MASSERVFLFWSHDQYAHLPKKLACSPRVKLRECHIFLDFYQGILKSTVSRVFEDLNFKISEGSDQN